MLLIKRIVALLWKNGLAYLLSLLTASLFFPLIFLVLEPNSTYSWWLILILSSLGMPVLFWPVVLSILAFNLIVYKAQHPFDKQRIYYMGLGVSLGIVLFLIYLVYSTNRDWIDIIQNFLLMSGIGTLYGFYFYYLTSKNNFSDSRRIS